MDMWPRIRRWAESNRLDNRGTVRMKFGIAQQQLEMRSTESIRWEPYFGSIFSNERIICVAFLLSICRVLLLDLLRGGIWYLGERCIRQIRNKIAIPDDPYAVMSEISPDEYFRFGGNWENATPFYTECRQEDYDIFWKKVSRGPLLPALSRHVNIDIVGFERVVPNEVRIPSNPTPSFAPTKYPIEYNVETSSNENIDWIVQYYDIHGELTSSAVPRPRSSYPVTSVQNHTSLEWRDMFIDAMDNDKGVRRVLLRQTREMAQIIAEKDQQIAERDAEIARLRGGMSDNCYRPFMDPTIFGNSQPTSSVVSSGFVEYSTLPNSLEFDCSNYPGLDNM